MQCLQEVDEDVLLHAGQEGAVVLRQAFQHVVVVLTQLRIRLNDKAILSVGDDDAKNTTKGEGAPGVRLEE